MVKGKILVTGGTGYIGSHTVCQLLADNYQVISIDNLSNSFEDVNERILKITGKSPLFYNVDLCDSERLNEVFKKHPDIESIIHFAALKSVGESVMFPLQYYSNNLLSLTNLLELARQHNIRSIVFSSSCTVYGQPDHLPVTELTPLKEPMSPYGNTKKICEEILRDYSKINPDSRIVCLRYFNPVGAHSSGMIGELPIGIPNNLMPYITQTASGIRDKLNIFGGDYGTSDGTAIRDYIHVVDLADAHLKAMERIIDNRMKQPYEVFNLGTGEGYSVLQMVHAFMEVTGVHVPYEIVGRREGDIEQIWADCSLANAELGWKATLTLKDMMLDTWRWEQFYRKTLTSQK
jgi:UDP-glucose 4-epimerase